MKLLFDHNVPHKMRMQLDGHSVSTADEMGWSEVENGELLRAAEMAGFEAMITCDKNLSYQQNLQGRALALVVLSTNNWKVLKRNLAPVVDALSRAEPGSFQFVSIQ